jgi:hypothetical protein
MFSGRLSQSIDFSDELLVTRKDVLRAKDGKTFEATERRIMLLNAAPYLAL